jgi:hypothetical protein
LTIGPPTVPPAEYRCSSGFFRLAGIPGSLLKKNGSALIQFVPRRPYRLPWMLLVPDAVLRSMCAPEVDPCCASYIDAFTRTSCIISGAGVGMALPMER